MREPAGAGRAVRTWLAAGRAATLLTWLAVTGVLALAFVLKFQHVQAHLALGLDPANYLVTMNALFGSDPTGLGLARPPLIAVPMKLFTGVFGTLTGIQALGAFAAVVIGIPFFLLAERIVGRYVALIATLLFVFSSAYSSMIAWGFLSFFGIFFIILTSYFLLRLLEQPSRKHALLTGLSGSLLVGFHQVSSLQFLLIIVPFLGLFLLLYPSRLRRAGGSLALAVAVGGALSLIYAPMYLLALAEGSGNPQLSGPFLRPASFSDGLGYLAIFYPNALVAVPVAIAAAIGLPLLWRTHRDVALLLFVLGIVSVGAAFVSVDIPGFTTVVRRLPYLSYIPLWLLAAVTFSALLGVNGRSGMPSAWSQRIPGRGTTLLVAGSVALGLLFSQALPDAQQRLMGAVNYYNYLDAQLWEAVQWAADNTAQDALFVAHPKIFGWWIEGASRRDVYETRDAASFYKSQEEESRIADLVLSRNQGLANGLLRAAITDPHPSRAGGDPVIGVFAAGQYQDVVLFHNHETMIETETGQLRLASMQGQTRLVETDGEGPVFEAVYQADSITIVRTIRLDAEEPEAVVSYAVHDTGGVARSLVVGLNLAMGQGAALEQTGPDSFRKRQTLRSFLGLGPVVTEMSVRATGAEVAVSPSERWDNHMIARAGLTGPEATVSFRLRVISPEPSGVRQAEHYLVPELLRAHGIEYIAVDRTIRSPLFNDLPWRMVWWLDEAPYLEVAFEEEDVKIYRVVPDGPHP